MMKSSTGYHTISISQKLLIEEEYYLNTAFYDYMRNGGQLTKEHIKNKQNQVIGIEYAYKNNMGIRWQVYNVDVGKSFRIYSVKSIINPNVLLNKDYIAVASESDVQKCKAAFNNESCKISPILGDFDSYSMSRSDYCANFNLEELQIHCTPAQMMHLLKRGNIPAHFAERTVYHPTSHRKRTDKNSFYLESNSVVINCYDKYAQLKGDLSHPCPNKEEAKNIIRFEIQCKYPKLYAMSKNHPVVENDVESSAPIFSTTQEMYEFYGDPLTYQQISLPIDNFLSDDVASEVIVKYFKRIIRSGDYYTLAKARHLIELSSYPPKKKEKLILALEMTSLNLGIYNAKLKLKESRFLDYNSLLIDLDDIGINPVTIPRGWNIGHIPNLLKAYHDKCSEVQKDE